MPMVIRIKQDEHVLHEWIGQIAKLADLEIEPLGPASDSERRTDSPLIERIRRNAEALRAQWLAEESASAEVEEKELAPF